MIFLISFFSFFCYSYEKGDKITLLGAKISPKDSPSLSLSIKNLPFCTIPENSNDKSTISDRLTGKKVYPLNIPIEFGVDKKRIQICNSLIKKEENIVFLKKAAYDTYWILYYIDDIPIYSHISTFDRGKPVFYTHYTFNFFFNNKGKIIDCNLSMSEPMDPVMNENYRFYLSTHWKQVDINASSKFDRFHEKSFFENNIRKYSLGNNILIIIFLIFILLITVAKMLVGNFSRDTNSKNLQGFELDLSNEKGWKTLHGDVFRPPQTKRIIEILVGAGYHILASCLIYLVMNKNSSFYLTRSGYISMFLFCLILASPFSGYFSAVVCKDYGESKWMKMSMIGASFTPILLYIIQSIISFNSFLNNSQKSLPFYHIFLFIIVLIIFILPLSAAGGYLGMRSKIFSGPKSDVSLVPRQIPRIPIIFNRFVISFVLGLIICIPMIVEFYYILATIWNMKYYYTWGYSILFIIFMIIITSLASIISISAIIQNEDHRWQWPSFVGPASAGLFCFVYCIYFWCSKLEMTGGYQFIDYILTSIIICLSIALSLGCIGFISCNVFIHKVFQIIKFD